MRMASSVAMALAATMASGSAVWAQAPGTSDKDKMMDKGAMDGDRMSDKGMMQDQNKDKMERKP
ncbi:MAG TPA: hypothetical protein VL948_09800 [Verrucomicrobiae bacterium]|jgi:hypothetical protein|nr:hypothetical protein [Verrucomicrobiae bacterium]